MATDLGAVYSLADFAATLNPDGTPAKVAQILHKRNGVLRFMHFELANHMTEHIAVKEAGLPAGAERSVNEATGTEKPQYEPIRESLSYIESRSSIDILMQTIYGSRFPQWRAERDLAHSEGLGQTAVSRLFYGTGLPGVLKGLTVRYGTIGSNVKTAGGATANTVTSLWVIQPGPLTFSLLIGAEAAPAAADEWSGGWVRKRDLGLQKVVDSTDPSKSYPAYETLFDALFGLCPYDDRAVQRLANIDLDGTEEVDPDQVIAMIEDLPNPDGPKYIVGNRNGIRQLKKNVSTRANVMWQGPDKYGQMADMFYGAQIILSEGITNTEAVIS